MRLAARSVCIFLVTTAAVALAGTAHAKSKELPPNAGRDALRQLVQDQCVANWTSHQDPAPCEKVVFPSSPSSGLSGYALLADPDGGAHYLIVPTQTMTGSDAAELLDANLPNYFEEGWRARGLLAKYVGRPVPRADVALAVGTAATRRQKQFHVHLSCLRREVADSLKAAAPALSEHWSAVNVAGFPFQGRRLADQALETTNPFDLVAALSPDARHQMGNYTVVVAGMDYADGPGFVLLTGNGPSGDLLLDSSCSVAGGGS